MLEMVSLQLRAEEFAAHCSFDPPTTPHDLLSALYRGFDKALLKDQASLLRTPAVAKVTSALAMEEVISSYKVGGGRACAVG